MYNGRCKGCYEETAILSRYDLCEYCAISEVSQIVASNKIKAITSRRVKGFAGKKRRADYEYATRRF